MIRIFLSIRQTLSQGRIARFHFSKVVGGYQAGFSCYVKRKGQGDGRGEGTFRENVASLFVNLGHEKEEGESRSDGRKKPRPATRLFLVERRGRGAGITPSFSSMSTLGHVM